MYIINEYMISGQLVPAPITQYRHLFLYKQALHVCMCVRLANDFINVKTETKQFICCEEIPTFYRQARFFTQTTNFTEVRLPHLPHTQLRHCWLIKSVLQLEQKDYVRPLELGGLNPYFFGIWEGLAPQPLCRTATERRSEQRCHSKQIKKPR